MTARELASDPSLGLIVRAGAGGLDRPIRWVHATELIDPSPYLRGGELIHTVALWRHTPADSERFVGALAASEATGICLGVGAGAGMPDSAPADLVAACDRHDMPLLEVPDATPFVRISETVIGTIMRRRAGGAERSLEREHDLVRAAVGADGIGGVVRVLADELDRDCWVLARSGRQLAATGPGLDHARTMAVLARARGARRYPASTPEGLVLPVPGGPDDAPGGWLVVGGEQEDWDTGAQAAIDQVVEFLAIECGRLQGLQVRERRFAAGLLELVIDGKLTDGDAAAALRDLGLATERPTLTLAASAPEANAACDLLDAIAWALGEQPLIAHSRGDAIALVGWDGTEADAHATVRDAAGSAAMVPGARDVAVGAGSVVAGTAGVRRGIAEARQALRATAARVDRPAVVTSRELGSHAMLLALQADDVREAFRASVLDPLLDYDERHRTELRHTLDTFLRTCAAWQRTADALHVHVNTLRYRLGRVEELTGRSLSSMDDRVDLHLALRVRDMGSEAAATAAITRAAREARSPDGDG
jgi:hypothetical protein